MVITFNSNARFDAEDIFEIVIVVVTHTVVCCHQLTPTHTKNKILSRILKLGFVTTIRNESFWSQDS